MLSVTSQKVQQLILAMLLPAFLRHPENNNKTNKQNQIKQTQKKDSN